MPTSSAPCAASFGPRSSTRYRAAGLRHRRGDGRGARGAVAPETSRARGGGGARRRLPAPGASRRRCSWPAARDDRSVHRHPIPTAAPLGRHALLAVTAEREGLHVSITRLALLRRAARGARRAESCAAAEVDAAMLAASRPGDACERDPARRGRRRTSASASRRSGAATTRAGSRATRVARSSRRPATQPLSPAPARSPGTRP